QVMAAAVGARFDRACRLAVRVPTARTPRKARRLVRRTDHVLARAIASAERAGRNDVTPSCAAAAVAALQIARGLVPAGPYRPRVIAGRAVPGGGKTGMRRRRVRRHVEPPIPLGSVDLLAGLAPGVELAADDLPP